MRSPYQLLICVGSHQLINIWHALVHCIKPEGQIIEQVVVVFLREVEGVGAVQKSVVGSAPISFRLL